MNKVATEVAIAVQSHTPVLLWGAPGTGKTSVIRTIGWQLTLPVEVVIASIREPSDFSGLPVVTDQGVALEPPIWAKRLAEAGKGLLFLDEISTAPPAVQAALLRVVLDRTIGDLQLPDGVAVVAAANPPDQAAGGWEISMPLANRFVHLRWSVDPQEWANGFLSGWQSFSPPKLPENWEEQFLPQLKGELAAFIHSRPQLLLQPPAQEEMDEALAWPSPRSWEMGIRLVAAAQAARLDFEIQAELLSGAVGQGAAIEFMSWRQNLDLPDPEKLLSNPSSFHLPERGDQAFAILSSVVSAVASRLDQKRWSAAWKIFNEAAKQGAVDIAASSARALLQLPDAKNQVTDYELLLPFMPVLQAAGMVH